ncbi:MAG: pseudouridine synthase [Nitrococcus sp.]|nr:pseudouridine synthase [Nitrococcus sp.]
MSETEKLQKVLARLGMGSRRQMEDWIQDGRVRVDGRVARLGERVAWRMRIMVDGRPLRRRGGVRSPRRILLYHKPVGEVTTRSDPAGRPTVFEHLPRIKNGRWIAVGRLDVNTCGLLLFTTDGELANRLMHPSSRLAREYAVRIYGEVTPSMIARLEQGVVLEDGRAAFDRIEGLSESRAANGWYRVRLSEGRRREVRRLWESQGVRVSRLIRLRFGPARLPPGLRQGQIRELDGAEMARLYRAVNLDPAWPRRRVAHG